MDMALHTDSLVAISPSHKVARSAADKEGTVWIDYGEYERSTWGKRKRGREAETEKAEVCVCEYLRK